QPVWLVLLALPFVLVGLHTPSAFGDLGSFPGTDGAHGAFSWTGFGLGMGVALSLIAQIGEQADYLRFMPTKTKDNTRAWNIATTVAGPGWVVLGAAKQVGGALLAVAALKLGNSAAEAVEPIHQYAE